MKKMGCLVPLLLLAGCEPPLEPPLEPERGVWTSSTRKVTVSQTEGPVSDTKCTFTASSRKLHRYNSEYGPGGRRSREDEMILTEEQAAHIEELLGRIRLDDASKPRDCWYDAPSLNILFVDDLGKSRLYNTDPAKESCGPSDAFVVKQDVLSVLDACLALLPVPPV